MATIIVHSRWDGYGAAERDRLLELLPADARRPAACLSRQWRWQPGAVLCTEVWRSEEDMRRFEVTTSDMLDRAGLAQPSHRTGFAVCDLYAEAYEQSRRAMQKQNSTTAVPVPRAPLEGAATREPAS